MTAELELLLGEALDHLERALRDDRLSPRVVSADTYKAVVTAEHRVRAALALLEVPR